MYFLPAIKVVHLNFDEFITESALDEMALYRGATPDGPLIRELSGNNKGEEVISHSRYMYVAWKSNWAIRYSGFFITFTSRQPGKVSYLSSIICVEVERFIVTKESIICKIYDREKYLLLFWSDAHIV